MPARKRPPSGFRDYLHKAQMYLYQRGQESAAKRQKETAGKDLRKFVEDNGVVYTDEAGHELTGNIVCLFPEPIEVGTKKFYGMELRKQPQITFDEDTAMDLVRAKKIPEEQVGEWEFVVNQDAFFVLQQQGTISEAELDSLLVEGDPKYSLWPVDKPPVDNDE